MTRMWLRYGAAVQISATPDGDIVVEELVESVGRPGVSVVSATPAELLSLFIDLGVDRRGGGSLADDEVAMAQSTSRRPGRPSYG